jgi:hypothetical protein
VGSTDLESTVRFFAETSGLSLIEQHEGLAQFVMPSGQLFEVFGSKSRYYQLHAAQFWDFRWRMYALHGGSWNQRAWSS